MNSFPGLLEANGISVTGEATQRVVPDFADVAIAVEASGKSAQQTLIENSLRMQRISVAAVNMGVKPEDMQTSGLRLDPLYPPSLQSAPMPLTPQAAFVAAAGDPPKGDIIGYHASSTLRISFEAVRIGELLDALVSAGANRIVAGPIFRLRDESQVRRVTLSRAAKNAQEKAEVVAIALAKKLGDPILVREEAEIWPLSSSTLAPFPAMGLIGNVHGATPVAPGELTYRARVNATYRFS